MSVNGHEDNCPQGPNADDFSITKPCTCKPAQAVCARAGCFHPESEHTDIAGNNLCTVKGCECQHFLATRVTVPADYGAAHTAMYKQLQGKPLPDPLHVQVPTSSEPFVVADIQAKMDEEQDGVEAIDIIRTAAKLGLMSLAQQGRLTISEAQELFAVLPALKLEGGE